MTPFSPITPPHFSLSLSLRFLFSISFSQFYFRLRQRRFQPLPAAKLSH